MKIAIDGGALQTPGTGNYQVTRNLISWLKIINSKNKYLIFSKPKRGWLYWYLPWQIIKNRVDVFIGLNQALPYFCNCKTAVLVHDLAFEYYPQCFTDKGNRLRRLTKQAISKATVIVTVSKSTKRDIIKLYGIPGSKIWVIYPGI